MTKSALQPEMKCIRIIFLSKDLMLAHLLVIQ